MGVPYLESGDREIIWNFLIIWCIQWTVIGIQWFDIASVIKEVAHAHASMIESLRAQITKLQSEVAGNNLKHVRLENESLSKNDIIEILNIEKEAMTEEIEKNVVSINKAKTSKT